MPTRDDDFDDDRPRRHRDEDDDNPPPRKSGNGIVIGIVVVVFVVCCGGGGTAAFFVFRGIKRGVEQVTETVQSAADAEQSRQNLMRIGRAAHDHHDAMGYLPNNSYEWRNNQVRPLLSWRVHLLPYLGEKGLYSEFKLDEPWDSANNIRLLNRMPAVYATPEGTKKAGEGKTNYRGFI